MTKVNPAIVLLIILGLSVSIRLTRSLTKGSAHSSVTQPFNSQILKPSVEPQVIPVHASTKTYNRKTTKPRPTPSELPDWAIARSLPFPSRQLGQEDSEVHYNLKTSPNFKYSPKLQKIVNEAVNLATERDLPKQDLSITLIDAKTGETAGHKQDTPRYPASVIKMFWMVVLYAQLENNIWESEDDFTPYLSKMIKESDNEAASLIVDLITSTRSSPTLKEEKFKAWRYKRQQINRFFQEAGYKNINIIQKTFPIYHINFPEPKGSESQLLGESIQHWNKITTRHAARLIYEICYAKQAVSPEASYKMCEWLKRDLNPKVWRKNLDSGFNPVWSFFGEGLSNTDAQLYSKAGWTSIARAETAMIDTGEQGKTYILVVFSGTSAYADDVQIFPKISRLVYKRMISQSSKK
ncbi:serine hydrolase [Scytonema sp. NUACC26]|uniref:serine hydrolase n=1 Tax=Scytonema sp. NUACC26 TaxID=3140176 RepID=UPI0034DC3416